MVLTTEQMRERISVAPMTSTGRFYRHAFRSMGTDCHIDFAAASPAAAGRFKQFVADWLAQFESKYSRFLPDSLLMKINAAAGKDWVEIDAETESLFALCDWFHWSTNGVFDPTSLPLIRMWDHQQARTAVPTDDEIKAARKLVGWTRVLREKGRVKLPDAGMAIDLGGIGKEYAVDRVLETALSQGIESLVVNFGHDLRVHGQPPEGGSWRIGIEDPTDTGRCFTGVGITDRAVCTSGDYLRYTVINGKSYGHILDPRTGVPVNNGCKSVTVVAPSCTEAGILSTTAFILGAKDGLDFLTKYQQAEGCIWADGMVYQTEGFRKYVI